MLVKKNNESLKYLKIFSVVCLLLLMFIFRTQLIESFFTFKLYISSDREPTTLTSSEYEELQLLRIENKTLTDELTKVRDEFSVGIIDEVKAPVYMLLGESFIYGDFYVSQPVGKTPYVGMNVFSTGNVVVGQVSKILPNSLKVEKLGKEKTFIAESMENQESLELQSLGGGLYFAKVAGGSKILVDDTIVLKGYPKAIVGKVVEKEQGDSSLSNIFVRSPYNIDNREIFYVIQ